MGEYGHLAYACSLCTACKGVCPVKIDLPKQLLLVRRDFVALDNIKPAERMAFAGFRWTAMSASRFGILGAMARKVLAAVRRLGLSGTSLDPTHAWTKHRKPLEIPRQSFRQWWKINSGK
jgi:L-lactate dehydrogenase complex protein LldF